jgi:hypothetical protein
MRRGGQKINQRQKLPPIPKQLKNFSARNFSRSGSLRAAKMNQKPKKVYFSAFTKMCQMIFYRLPSILSKLKKAGVSVR